MENKMTIEEAVDLTIATLRGSSDYTDARTVSSFMLLLDTVIESPKNILMLKNPLKLSIVLTSLVTSGFPKRYPRYYNYNTGMVACAVGFYCFMKQLKTNVNAHNLPTIIVLLHDGRDYMAKIVEDCLTSSMSPYNPLDMFDFEGMDSKKYAVVKVIEYIMHKKFNDYGLSDMNLDAWKSRLNLEIKTLEQIVGTDDYFSYAIKVYEHIEQKLRSSAPFVFEE